MSMRETSARDFPFEDALYDESLDDRSESGAAPLIGEGVVPASLAAAHLVTYALQYLTLAVPIGADGIVRRLDPLSGNYEMNRFTRVPNCSRCSLGGLHA
jgi:hypothetical protein